MQIKPETLWKQCKRPRRATQQQSGVAHVATAIRKPNSARLKYKLYSQTVSGASPGSTQQM